MRRGKQNYLERIPRRNPEIRCEQSDDGKIRVWMEWKGFFHSVAQKFFGRPRFSDVKLDDYGSRVWLLLDGTKDVYQIAQELEAAFPDMEKPLERTIKFLEILHDNHLICWQDEK